MKNHFALCLMAALLAAACGQQDKEAATTPHITDTAVAVDKTAGDTLATAGEGMDVSTYDDPAALYVDAQKHNLERMAAAHVFEAVNNHLYYTLPEAHQAYLAGTDYDVLYMAEGDLYGQGKRDAAFIVYDNRHSRISIVIYNAGTKKYGELYRDIEVYNALAKADCNFGVYPTPDCQLGNEMTYYDRSLENNPAYIEQSASCKIADIQQDSTFILKDGCFAPGMDKKAARQALCITTSWTYNNWQCLYYDKGQNAFVVFYGQAFAD